MRLILTRHGETEENANQIIMGQLPGKLTEKGRKEAFLTGKRLAREKIDWIYCSDLERAKESAKEIRKEVKAPMRYTKELRELNVGVFAGKPGGSIRKYVEERNLDRFTFVPEGGESFQQLRGRAAGFYQKMLDRHQGETVLWITHGRVLTELFLYLEKREESFLGEFHHLNGAVSVLEIDDKGKHEVKVFKCLKHLA